MQRRQHVARARTGGDHPATFGSRSRGQDQRQRDRAVEQVGAQRLAGGLRVAVAVEDVVGDLEGQAERLGERAERGEVGVAQPAEAAAQHRRGGEQAAGLQPAALQVLVDRRVDGRPPARAAGSRRGRATGRRRRAASPRAGRRSRPARRRRARTGSRRWTWRPARRASPTPSAGRAAAARGRAGRRAPASPCAPARRRSRRSRGSRRRAWPAAPTGAPAAAAAACRRTRASCRRRRPRVPSRAPTAARSRALDPLDERDMGRRQQAHRGTSPTWMATTPSIRRR